MPKVDSPLPPKLRPYRFHGLDLNYREGEENVITECPWCGEPKLSIQAETGVWRCYRCSAENESTGQGNLFTFLRRLADEECNGTTEWEELRKDRCLLDPKTLDRWGLRSSRITREWILPGYNLKRQVVQLYRYGSSGSRRVWMTTPGLVHQLLGLPLFDPDKEEIYLCEGVWDAMVLWEVLCRCKEDDEGNLRMTSQESAALISGINVLAVPGCSVFNDGWIPLFRDKRVTILYDNDHPLPSNPKGDGAGLSGVKRVANLLKGVARDINYLRWGDAGYDPSLPSGYDVRDYLTEGEGKNTPVNDLGGRLRRFEELRGLIRGAEESWFKEKKTLRRELGGVIEPVECSEYARIINAWRKALLWTDGLDHALAVMLASIASTSSVGDPLWLKVIGPAACGKSTLCEALSVSRSYVVAKSIIRGFHSGYRLEEGDSGQDHSLISVLNGKTLIIKDGDTLLQSPNLAQILSEARDLYDGVSRTHYRNAISKDYDNIRTTIILCGTSSLRAIDQSELGERTLDCVITEGIDDELEDEISTRVGHRAFRNLGIGSGEDGKAIVYQPELREAMQLTGGYVEWLRKNAAEKLSTLEVTDATVKQCTRLAKFVAYMRARPSIRQEETAERELASRLTSQISRLAGCLSLVLNRTAVDDEVIRRVKQVAFDTARGQTLAIVAHLYDVHEEGSTVGSLALLTGITEEKMKALLRFLKRIHAVEPFTIPGAVGPIAKVRWRLTKRLDRLYREVLDI